MLKKPELTSSLSFGNIITIVTVIGGLAAGWGQMQGQVDRLEEQAKSTNSELIAALDKFESRQQDMEERIRRQEEMNARMDERFTLILAMISEVKSQVTSLTEARIGN